MLTPKQYRLLSFLHDNISENGICPSFEEMKKAVGLKSKSGIHRLILELEKRRFIRRTPGHSRALEVITLPAIRSLKTKLKPIIVDAADIPLYGKIAAGVPIEAINENVEEIAVPPQMTGAGEHYALTVEGDSMKNAGIMDGDTVIIKREKHVSNGTIVVALIDGYEVTLKRFFRRGSMVALQPENEKYETRLIAADRIEVQGVLVGLMRQY